MRQSATADSAINAVLAWMGESNDFLIGPTEILIRKIKGFGWTYNGFVHTRCIVINFPAQAKFMVPAT